MWTEFPKELTYPFDQLANVFADDKFDLVLSNFGGLNCIPKKALTRLRNDLEILLTTNGHLFLTLLSRCCLWEIIHYGIRGKFITAFRRFKRSVDFILNGQTMPVYYYSPTVITKIFKPIFTRLIKIPVGLFIPPSYLETGLHAMQVD